MAATPNEVNTSQFELAGYWRGRVERRSRLCPRLGRQDRLRFGAQFHRHRRWRAEPAAAWNGSLWSAAQDVSYELRPAGS
jgi:hypothetical protein